jgi:hypothetical protein
VPRRRKVATPKSFGKRRSLIVDFDRQGDVVGVQMLEPGAFNPCNPLKIRGVIC